MNALWDLELPYCRSYRLLFLNCHFSREPSSLERKSSTHSLSDEEENEEEEDKGDVEGDEYDKGEEDEKDREDEEDGGNQSEGVKLVV